MYAVLAEDESDASSIASIIRLIKNDTRIPVWKKGFGGSGELLKNGYAQIKAYNKAKNCDQFIICYDSDGDDPDARKNQIIERIIKPSGVAANYCALVPVQELEAWFLSDLNAVKKIFRNLELNPEYPQPESLVDPKEILRHRLKGLKPVPRYVNGIHNPQIASALDVSVVLRKCRSFSPLFELVMHGRGNVH
ncbi:DUF4276 family protein [Comamonas jiangduensis]|uniref:DUF4276 family protein n=1 Tax=Comamonas jiangduensis TaxID=1194168 RepID=UPI0028A84482|nr:DUF4276 family protein [Comamonas jiangduensis]